MSVTAHWYDKALEDAFNNSPVFWTSDTIKVALLTSSYTPAQGTDHVWSDISANEVVGAGYTTGGATLGSKTEGLAAHVLKLTGANTSWASATITARYAAIYDTTVSNKLLGYVNFGADVVSTNGTFQITWDAAGILTITAS